MTEYHIEIGKQAQDDLTDIVRYVGEILKEPRTAGKLYRLLKQEIMSLHDMPERYPYEEEARSRSLKVRKLLVKNYKVLYMVRREKRLVQIVRVVYAGRDISKQLEESDFSSV